MKSVPKRKLYMGIEFELFFNGTQNSFRQFIKKNLSKWDIPFRGKNSFDVKRDGSLETNKDGFEGIEFVTPVMPFGVGKQFMKSVLNLMRKSEKIHTNDTCGLHINLSYQQEHLNMEIDPHRIYFALDEESLLKDWNRIHNHYSQPRTKEIITWIKRNKRKSHWDLRTGLNRRLLSECEHSDAISFEKIEDVDNGWNDECEPYMEFRIMGGVNYEHKQDKIAKTLKEYEKAMQWASSPYYDRFCSRKINKILLSNQKKQRILYKEPYDPMLENIHDLY